MFETLTLSDIPKKQYGILKKPSSTSPAVWRIQENGVKAVVKDFHFNGFWYRNIVGRFLVWRESKAYRRLKGLKGVPEFYRTVQGQALIVEEIQGTDIESLEIISNLDDNFYSELKDLIDKFHERGIVHCDLKRAPNIMLGEDGKPYIVDWAAAISRSELKIFPLNLIYDRFLQDDHNAITKLKLKYRPESVSREENDLYLKRSRAEIVIRKVREFFRQALKKIA